MTDVNPADKTLKHMDFQSKDINDWDAHDVKDWLESIGMDQYKKSFGRITGKILAKLTEDRLEKLLNGDFSDVVVIFEAINEVKEKGQVVVKTPVPQVIPKKPEQAPVAQKQQPPPQYRSTTAEPVRVQPANNKPQFNGPPRNAPVQRPGPNAPIVKAPVADYKNIAELLAAINCQQYLKVLSEQVDGDYATFLSLSKSELLLLPIAVSDLELINAEIKKTNDKSTAKKVDHIQSKGVDTGDEWLKKMQRGQNGPPGVLRPYGSNDPAPVISKPAPVASKPAPVISNPAPIPLVGKGKAKGTDFFKLFAGESHMPAKKEEYDVSDRYRIKQDSSTEESDMVTRNLEAHNLIPKPAPSPQKAQVTLVSLEEIPANKSSDRLGAFVQNVTEKSKKYVAQEKHMIEIEEASGKNKNKIEIEEIEIEEKPAQMMKIEEEPVEIIKNKIEVEVIEEKPVQMAIEEESVKLNTKAVAEEIEIEEIEVNKKSKRSSGEKKKEISIIEIEQVPSKKSKSKQVEEIVIIDEKPRKSKRKHKKVVEVEIIPESTVKSSKPKQAPEAIAIVEEIVEEVIEKPKKSHSKIKKIRRRRHATKTIETVDQFLDQIGFNNYSSVFKEQQVDLNTLLTLTEEDFGDLKLPSNDAKFFVSSIAKHKAGQPLQKEQREEPPKTDSQTTTQKQEEVTAPVANKKGTGFYETWS